MAESLIYDLCKSVASKVTEKGSHLIGVPEEAKKMQEKLERIEAVLKAAEQRELDDVVKKWIRELKDVAYDIEDVLDDWSIPQRQIQDQAGTSQRGNKSKSAEGCFSFIPTPCFCFKQAKSQHRIAHAIIEINKRLDGIYEGKQKFNFPTTVTGVSEGPKREPTTSYEYYTVVQSQEESKAELIKKLVDSDFKGSAADRIPIISIVGMGGMGKSTVARLVYEDQEVKNYFSQMIAWVCVSNTFNAMNVAKAIARDLCRISTNESELQCVLTEIENFIRGKKFLLILDDVWEESQGKWNAVLKCLSKGDTQGSRILMTTRNSNFSRTMGADIVLVNKLSKIDAMLLFSYYAFPGDPDHRGEVEDIAIQLVEKCDGLPLALQVLGSHMVTKTTRSEWDDVLSSEMWKTEFKERVFNSLAFSYLELRSQAKRCFAFCSVFPKDAVMEKSELIRLWMSQGYLQGANQMDVLREEVLGEECFESLLRRSFFQKHKLFSDEDTDVEVTMHDIVHDFAQYISNDEVAILDPSLEMKGTNDNLRHLAFSREIINESECQLSSLNLRAYKLRTLFIHTHKPTDKLWSKISYIRALHIKIPFKSETLDGYDFKDIGKLIHLRYVSLGFEKITVLPEEICRLSCLQTLDLTRCYDLEKLPKDIGRLAMLRHLLFFESVTSLPKGLGKLSSLRTLSSFMCGGLANEDCISLEDLSLLNNIRGDLRLRNLNNVASVDEATRAALDMKTQIRRLTLEFGDGDASLQLEVLEALQPAKEKIEFLEIKNYKGKVCPPWIGQMRCLKEVRLFRVSVESLPELGTLTFLEKLFVMEANKVRHVGAEIFGIVKEGQTFFPKLKSLLFISMSNWEQWNDPEEIMSSGVTVMPSLHSLEIRNCRALQTLPRFLLEHVPLESFEVDINRLPPVELAEDDYPNRWRIGDTLLPQTLKTIDSAYIKLRKEASQLVQQQPLVLICVEIDAAYRLSTVMVPGWIMDFAYLRNITLSHLEDVRLPPLGALAYLEELTIRNAKKVEKVGDEFLGISYSNNNNVGDHRGGGESTTAFIAFPRLKKLSFHCMSAWREWEDPVHGNNLIIMPSLHYLTITMCVKLKILPHFVEGVVSSLEKLHVGATAEGDMPKIQSAGEDEAANYEMSKGWSTTTTHAQLELRGIMLEGVRNEWLLDWAKYCVRLTELQLRRCAVASLVGQLEVSLPSLEKLIVSGSYFRRMGVEMLRISSLKELRFHGMPEWEEWEEDAPPHHQPESTELSQHGNNNNASIINFTSNLRVLDLDGCPKLKALPSSLRSVRTLQQFTIMDCEALKTWWETEAGEDWRKWISTIPTVNFQS